MFWRMSDKKNLLSFCDIQNSKVFARNGLRLAIKSTINRIRSGFLLNAEKIRRHILYLQKGNCLSTFVYAFVYAKANITLYLFLVRWIVWWHDSAIYLVLWRFWHFFYSNFFEGKEKERKCWFMVLKDSQLIHINHRSLMRFLINQ